MRKKYPDFNYERKLWKQGCTVIAFDEVGRGALAGPVYIGIIVMPPPIRQETIREIEQLGINDSKLLSPDKRMSLVKIIKEYFKSFIVNSTDVDFINKYGIVPAIFEALKRSISAIMTKDKNARYHCLLDGYTYPDLEKKFDLKQTGIIKGDRKCISIAAASIIAKVARDQYMSERSLEYPDYRWHENKGYGTKAHREAIKKYGKTPLHRDLFLRKILG